MKNAEIAELLYEMADLNEMLDIQWKPMAYRKAARAIEALSDELGDIYREKGYAGLRDVPGVGEGIAKHIEEMLMTGKLKAYDKLAKRIPRGVETLMHVMGMGPKRAMILYKKLKITSIKQLEVAAKAGKIRKLAGFGAKSEEDILRGIKLLKSGQERKVLGTALPIARELESRLKKIKGVKAVVASGSLRRRKESVGDIDILTIAKSSKKIMDFFTKMSEVRHVIAKGPTKTTVILQWGPISIQTDVRVLPEKSFGAALQYFTGSKEHNINLRRIAIKKGYKLSEYGLFNSKTGKYIVGRTEQDVYKKLGLPYIEPELRENEGEVEAARKGKLPKLIPYNALRGNLHTHTKWSDGNATTEQMVAAATKLKPKFEYLAITDHSKSQHIARGLDEKRLTQHIKEIRQVQRKFPKIHLLAGSEVDILPNGKMDYSDATLKKLDWVVASIHSRFKSPKDEMTKRIVKALQNPHVNALGHPTGRLIGSREPYQFDLEKVFTAATENSVALEINCMPNRLDLKDAHIRIAKELGCKFVINTDAHAREHLTLYELGIAQARRGWLEAKHVINTLPWKRFKKII